MTVNRLTYSAFRVAGDPTYYPEHRGGELESYAPQKLYALARQGIDVKPKQRWGTIHRIDIDRWKPPRLRVRISCEAGTYVRALGRDLGENLGVGG